MIKHNRCLDCNFHKAGQTYKQCEQNCFYKKQLLEEVDNKMLQDRLSNLEQENNSLKLQIQEMLKDLEVRKTCNEESDYYWDTYVFNEEYPFNKENAYKELSDYYFMLEQLPKIYMELSGGICSYPNYPASSIIQAHNDYVERLTSEYTDRINQLEDILIDVRKNTEDDYVIKKCDEADL